MTSRTSPTSKIAAAQTLAPEDIQPGLYIAVLHEICQHIPLFWDETTIKPIEPVRIAWLPEDSSPLKVVDVCLPFVQVEAYDRSLVTLDVRRHRLARLDESYGRRVFRRLKARKRIQRARDDD